MAHQPPIHRNGDPRNCGAVTTVLNQTSKKANGQLVAVEATTNSHGNGGLIADCKQVFVEGKLVVNHTPDNAVPDNICPIPPHCNPQTAGGSPNVFVAD